MGRIVEQPTNGQITDFELIPTQQKERKGKKLYCSLERF